MAQRLRSWLTRLIGRTENAEVPRTCKHKWTTRKYPGAARTYEVTCASCGKQDYAAGDRLTERDQSVCPHKWERISFSSDTDGSWEGKKCYKCGKSVGSGYDPYGNRTR